MIDPIPIRLTSNELFIAAVHAVMRRFRFFVGLSQERTPNNTQATVDWDNDINSCCAEMAFAKVRDIYWSGLSDLRSPDTSWAEVRWTRLKDRGGLIIYLNDRADRRFVLLDGNCPEYRVIGWFWGREGKLQKFWDRLSDSYYLIPRENLHGFDAESLTLPCPAAEPTEPQAPIEPQSTTRADSSATSTERLRGASSNYNYRADPSERTAIDERAESLERTMNQERE